MRWKPGNGWDICISFWNLENLTAQMEKASLKGKVTKIGILAHGDRGGLIQLDRDLTRKTLGQFASDFAKLYRFFGGWGKLIFFSCIAGLGPEGDLFLSALSKLLPGIVVVGFTENNWVPGSVGGGTGWKAGDFAPSPAGSVYKAGHLNDANPASYRGKPLLTEFDESAKWAAQGWIVRPPKREVINLQTFQDNAGKLLNPDKFCGSVSCKGHSAFGHWCRQYKRHPNTMKHAEHSHRLIRNSYGAMEYRILIPNGKPSSSNNPVKTRSFRRSHPTINQRDSTRAPGRILGR